MGSRVKDRKYCSQYGYLTLLIFLVSMALLGGGLFYVGIVYNDYQQQHRKYESMYLRPLVMAVQNLSSASESFKAHQKTIITEKYTAYTDKLKQRSVKKIFDNTPLQMVLLCGVGFLSYALLRSRRYYRLKYSTKNL
ncbi:MAG: hypothetical protein ACNI27_01655 [Desulfovibrio sp.]